MKAQIKAISYYLPSIQISNEILSEKYPEWSIDKITAKIGINNRYIVDHNTCSSDLGVESAKKLFSEHNISPDSIDYVLFCTQSPDYFLPTTACLIQNRLNIPITAGSMDYNLGCSGFVYGLGLAKGLIESEQAKNVLLITAETYSKYIGPEDKGNQSIFGDAASSTLITTCTESSLESFVYGTDGRGANNLIVEMGGMRMPAKHEIDGNVKERFLYMNGGEIFSFTLKAVPELVSQVLKKADMNVIDIDLFIFHQANKYMLETLRKKINIPEEKFLYYMEECGNTVSSTIPIVLYHAIKENRIKKGTKVLLAGFGVGYSWAGCIIKF